MKFDVIKNNIIKQSILIRTVENYLLKLFSKGKLNGTVHTCIGQELSATTVINLIDKKNDDVMSNHRCHGHYLTYTNNDIKGLINEILGNKKGICGGRGGSQNLHYNNFYSSGIQGGIVAISAGMSLSHKLNKNNSMSVVFIGDGTLGEGIIYETFNICALWKLPLLIVLENNFYSQSTKQKENLYNKNICEKIQSFGIKSKKLNIWNIKKLYNNVKKSIHYIKKYSKPFFIQIDCYRLKAHSKGDDDRNIKEIKYYQSIDPINKIENEFHNYKKSIIKKNRYYCKRKK